VSRRLPILRHFDAPPVLASEMCAEINGYFGSRSSYNEKSLKSYSTWMRCLVKMILDEPLPDGKKYIWYEMTFLSRWDASQDLHQILCIDTPNEFPEKILQALREDQGLDSNPKSSNYSSDPFSMHALLLDQVVELNDKSVWNIRHPIRDIEKV